MSVVITSLVLNETNLAATKNSSVHKTSFASGAAVFVAGNSAGGSFNFQLCASPDGTISNFDVVDEESISGVGSATLKSSIVAPFLFVRAVRGAGASFTGTAHLCIKNG